MLTDRFGPVLGESVPLASGPTLTEFVKYAVAPIIFRCPAYVGAARLSHTARTLCSSVTEQPSFLRRHVDFSVVLSFIHFVFA